MGIEEAEPNIRNKLRPREILSGVYDRMSDRDRVLVAAAAIGLIFCALIWSAIGIGLLTRGPESPSANASIEDRRGSYDDGARPSAATYAHEACAEIAESSDNKTEQRDLCAQFLAALAAQDSANLPNGQTIIGGVGLAAVFFTLLLNAIATFAATSQAATARRALEDLERPYLFAQVRPLVVASGTISVVDAEERRKPSAVLEYDFSNLGRAPALIVRFERKRYALRVSEGFPAPLNPNAGGRKAPHGAVVPVGKNSQEFVMREIPSRASEPTAPDDPFIWYFVGFVVYRQVGSDREYAMGFGYRHSAGFFDNDASWVLLETGRHPDEYNYDRNLEATTASLPHRLRAAWRALWGAPAHGGRS